MGELLSFSILESANWKMKVFWAFKVLSKGNVWAMDNNDYQLKDGEVDSLFKVV